MPITQRDIDDYGPELIDMTQRAAADVVAPHLQALNEQTAALQRQVAIERRKNLDQQVERAVPNYRTIDNDPRWHQWLLGVDPLNGVIRQQLLNAAIERGDLVACVAMFRGWANEFRDSQSAAAPATASRGRSSNGGNKPVYDNESIKELYERHRKGLIPDAEWARIENDIFAAQREGRINVRPFWTK
jgi:hypothetical protein